MSDSEPVARIRRLDTDDAKLMRFNVGQAVMEELASANHWSYIHPLLLSAYIAISCIFMQLANWWPKPEHGYLGYLAPLPAFGSVAFAYMFSIDWFNRPYFEDHTRDVLRRPDLVDPKAYYTLSPSSGFWILEYGSKFVGLIALDASVDFASETQVKPDDKLKLKRGTSNTATIRHFFVDAPYRPTGIQHDLLEHALRVAFDSSPSLEKVVAVQSSLTPYISKSLRKAGFKPDPSSQKARKSGFLGFKAIPCSIDRAAWEKAAEKVVKGKAAKKSK